MPWAAPLNGHLRPQRPAEPLKALSNWARKGSCSTAKQPGALPLYNPEARAQALADPSTGGGQSRSVRPFRCSGPGRFHRGEPRASFSSGPPTSNGVVPLHVARGRPLRRSRPSQSMVGEAPDDTGMRRPAARRVYGFTHTSALERRTTRAREGTAGPPGWGRSSL